MKYTALLLLLSCALLTGCFSSRIAPPHYTLGFDEALAERQLLLPPARSVHVSLAEDLGTLHSPYVLHKDGRVTIYRALTYYAPIDVAIERAIKECATFTPPTNGYSRLKLTLTRYCIDLRGDSPQVCVQFETNVTSQQASSTSHPLEKSADAQTLHTKAICALPLNYTAQDVRKAFARALIDACTIVR